MLFVVKVNRVSSRNARVVLSDGLPALVPSALAEWGEALNNEDLVFISLPTGNDRWHTSLLKKTGSSKKKLFRDFSTYDARKEFELIRCCILKCYRKVFGKFWASDQFDDVCLEVFMHLWERDCFRGWDPSMSRYEAYVQTAVRNCLIDIARNRNVQQFRSSLSLNTPVSKDVSGGIEKIDLLVDMTNQDATEKLQADALYNMFRARVLELDNAHDSGWPGLSYKAVFEALVSGSLDDYKSSFNYSPKLIDLYAHVLRKELSKVYEVMAG